MSYNVAVWVGARPADNAAARLECEYLLETMDSDEPAHPAILAYIDDLTKQYPDLMDLDDDHIDSSPWADGPLTGNVTGPFFYFAMTYPGAREAGPFVAETAAQHGLVCFDPQTNELI